MTSIFLAQTPGSTSFVDQLRLELESKGYTVPEYPSSDAASYASRVERGILGSAAVVLLWSGEAAHAGWEALHIHFAQRFFKPLFPLLLDTTPLPDALMSATTLSGQLPPAATVAALLALPDFPRPNNTDPLLKLFEQATNNSISLRRVAIETAADMLMHEQHRAAILALLTYLADRDLISSIRKQARAVLELDVLRRVLVPPFSAADAPYIVGGRCKESHESYYDKRLVCKKHRDVALAPKTDSGQLDELILPCQEKGCKLKVVVHVDCRDYL